MYHYIVAKDFIYVKGPTHTQAHFQLRSYHVKRLSEVAVEKRCRSFRSYRKLLVQIFLLLRMWTAQL